MMVMKPVSYHQFVIFVTFFAEPRDVFFFWVTLKFTAEIENFIIVTQQLIYQWL